MADEKVALQVDLETGKVTGEVANLKRELREAQRDAMAVAEQFGATSKEAAAAAKRAADLRDRVGDAKALVEAFNPDRKFQAFSTALQGVAGGFSAVTGAMGLLGVESEDTEKMLMKVQSALALSQGINSILELKDQFTNLVAVLGNVSVVQKANAVANTLAAGTMRLFGAATVQTGTAFNVLKGAIIATGIGALVVLVGTAISAFQEWNSEVERAAEKQKELQDSIKKLNDVELQGSLDYIEREQKLAIARAKARGDSNEQIAKMEQEFNNSRIRMYERSNKELNQFDLQTVENDKKIKDLKVENEINRLNAEAEARKKAEEKAKKRAEENAKAAEEERKRKEQERFDEELRIQTEHDIRRAQIDVARQQNHSKYEDKKTEITTVNLQNRVSAEINAKAKEIENEKAGAEAKKKIAEYEANARIVVAGEVAKTLMGLSQLAGEQTQVGKALAIASTTITTISSAVEAYKRGMEIPYVGMILAPINAGIALAAGYAQIRKISAIKIPNGGGGMSSVSMPSASMGGGGITPNPITTTNTSLDSNTINELGNKTNRAYVVESDNQSAVRRAERLSRAGVLNI